MGRFLFPRWANWMPAAIFFGVLGPFGTVAVAGIWYYGTDKFWSVGYTPKQPVDYSHKLHAGDMGMDCRYCHNTVERSSYASIPPVQTCMNCHAKVKTDSVKLIPLMEAWKSGEPLPWVKVHNLPDYAYFNHSVHVAAGVGCSSCHGRVDQMVRVSQQKPLTMGWCLDCHRDPREFLRNKDQIANMDWKRDPKEPLPALTGDGLHIHTTAPGDRPVNPPTHCSGCHR